MEKLLTRRSIIVTDDDDGDRYLIDKALKENGVENQIHFIKDGQALVDHLLQRSSDQPVNDQDLPCLILLDLNMPRLDGHEALKIIKGYSALKDIPIIILTGSKNSQDVKESYQEGANSFFTKPFNYVELVELMGVLKTYWFENAKLPPVHPENS